jgi:tRNA splicing ligase
MKTIIDIKTPVEMVSLDKAIDDNAYYGFALSNKFIMLPFGNKQYAFVNKYSEPYVVGNTVKEIIKVAIVDNIVFKFDSVEEMFRWFME